MEKLITANLKSRPTRTVISIFAVAIGVILMLVIDGITSGTLNDSVTRTMSVGADFILQPSDSGILYALGSPALNIKLVPVVREMPGVGAVTPVISHFITEDFALVFGIDLKTYDQFPGALQIVEGKRSLTGDDVIVDELYARKNKIKPGSKLTIKFHEFTVTGICRQGSVVREFVSLDTLQKLKETPGNVSLFYIKAAPGKDRKELESELKQKFQGYHVIDASDAEMMLQGTKIPMLKQFTIAVKVVSMLISFMVILLAMYTTIFERTREIGILKSLGASRGFVVSIVMRESVFISILGVILGTGISEIIRKIITSTFPTLQIQMSLTEIGISCALGLIAGWLGALYPAYTAARMDPVKALSYE